MTIIPPSAALKAAHLSSLTAQGLTLADGLLQQEVADQATMRFSSGHDELDRLLPRGGLERGTLVEWFVESEVGLTKKPGEPWGYGGATLAMLVAQHALAACSQQVMVVVDSTGQFYPPAAAAWGIDLKRLIFVQPASTQEALWAIDQALRCPAVGSLWARLGTLDDRWFRRFQLSVRQGGGVGMLVRPRCEQDRPSWADVQFSVTGRAPLHVELLRCRGLHQPRSFLLERDAMLRWRIAS